MKDPQIPPRPRWQLALPLEVPDGEGTHVRISVFAIVIAFGHSFLAMSGFEPWHGVS
jgi:hypothetical protein